MSAFSEKKGKQSLATGKRGGKRAQIRQQQQQKNHAIFSLLCEWKSRMAYQCFCEWMQGLSVSARQSLGMAWSYPMRSWLDDSFREACRIVEETIPDTSARLLFPSPRCRKKKQKKTASSLVKYWIHINNLLLTKLEIKTIQVFNLNTDNDTPTHIWLLPFLAFPLY